MGFSESERATRIRQLQIGVMAGLGIEPDNNVLTTSDGALALKRSKATWISDVARSYQGKANVPADDLRAADNAHSIASKGPIELCLSVSRIDSPATGRRGSISTTKDRSPWVTGQALALRSQVACAVSGATSRQAAKPSTLLSTAIASSAFLVPGPAGFEFSGVSETAMSQTPSLLGPKDSRWPQNSLDSVLNHLPH